MLTARETYFKCLDRFFRITGFYNLLFSRGKARTRINTLEIQKPSLSRKVSKPDNKYWSLLSKDSTYIFGKETPIQELDLQADKPFWKVDYQGYDPKDNWELVRGWQWLPAYLEAVESEQPIVLEKIQQWLE